MARHSLRFFSFLVAVSLNLVLSSQSFPAKTNDPVTLFQNKGLQKAPEKSAKELPEIPENLDREKINAIVAGLSDEQVRRLLIQELEKASSETARKNEQKEAAGLGRIVKNAEENITLFHKRLADLQAGAVAVPDFLPQTYANLRGEGGVVNVFLMIGKMIFLLAGGFAAERLFALYAAGMRKRLTDSPHAHWLIKVKRQALCAAIDFISIVVFSITSLVLFFLFLNHGPLARLVFLIYMIVVLTVRGISLLSRFILAPETPELRWLPLGDRVPRYIHRWIMRIFLVLAAGFMVRGLLELQAMSEESVLFLRATTAGVLLFMLVYLALDNRDPIARLICQGSGERSAGANLLRSQLAAFWHLLAIPYLALVWALWMFYLFVGRSDLVLPILALISSMPLFVIFDFLGQRLLSTILGFVDERGLAQQDCEVEGAVKEDKAGPGVYKLSRLVPVVRHCLSLSIAGIIFFWLLRLWGFEVRLGEQATVAALKVLLVTSLAYVAWRLIEGAINRRLEQVQVNTVVDEESEAGGEGGSRVGTLLHLIRKFFLVVLLVTVGLIILSEIGIDTTPLLAGAGIVGLALGLGTQNLIKDIVSGLFFLIDDAFRIGDYVESGKAKGTVEAISIRSLRLRHTRGMVHTVPFSQLGMVTNFSRDYIIVKLNVPVPYDTDIDRFRKVVKKIYKEIQEDDDLGPGLLGPIKSAGVSSLGDSALIMRVKFKSKPGIQFLIQRQVLRRLQELFGEHGLKFATRSVMVSLPEDSTSSKLSAQAHPEESVGRTPQNKLLSAAAGAAIAVAVAEEEEFRQKQMEQTDEDQPGR